MNETLESAEPQTAAAETTPAIEINGLVRRYGKADAVRGLDLTVKAGRCFGLFGRNGAGKTTTMKCLLGHLKPTSGSVRIFGLNPARHEVEVKRRIGYVPETMGFYPWMTAGDMLDYAASFRPLEWSRRLEKDLLGRFRLERGKKIAAMSKGMRAQVALICAIAAEPDLLLLDEPTSGLDPIVRREFIETVIGAFQDADPGRRTVFVCTHLISEFEGLIDEFAIMDNGRAVATMESDAARARYRKAELTFDADAPPPIDIPGVIARKDGPRRVDLTFENFGWETEERLRALNPRSMDVRPLPLEEIFVAVGKSVPAGSEPKA